MLESITKVISFRKFRPPKTVLNPLANCKIQGLFKAFECFSSTFHGKFYFQGLFKTVLSIQVLFKPVGTLLLHNNVFDTLEISCI